MQVESVFCSILWRHDGTVESGVLYAQTLECPPRARDQQRPAPDASFVRPPRCRCCPAPGTQVSAAGCSTPASSTGRAPSTADPAAVRAVCCSFGDLRRPVKAAKMRQQAYHFADDHRQGSRCKQTRLRGRSEISGLMSALHGSMWQGPGATLWCHRTHARDPTTRHAVSAWPLGGDCSYAVGPCRCVRPRRGRRRRRGCDGGGGRARLAGQM